MDFLIREATEEDCEGLCEIFDEGDLLHIQALPQIFVKPKEPYRDREFVSRVIADDDSALFIAESDGRVVGLIHVVIREPADVPVLIKRRYAYIDEILVAETQRGSGIGKSLMEEAEQWAIQQNVSELELNVWDFNMNAIDFFTKIGYTTSRHSMWKSI